MKIKKTSNIEIDSEDYDKGIKIINDLFSNPPMGVGEIEDAKKAIIVYTLDLIREAFELGKKAQKDDETVNYPPTAECRPSEIDILKENIKATIDWMNENGHGTLSANHTANRLLKDIGCHPFPLK